MSKTYVPVSLRRLVFERAQNNCEYCLNPASLALATHQIDHIIAEKHGGKTVTENLALSCVLCNMAKGSDIASVDPKSNEIARFYHPRQDRWMDHFRLNAKTGQIEALTSVGRATAQLLQLNRPKSISERLLLLQVEQLVVPDSTVD
ncbi:MAG: HNH endonuclease [Phormidesmis priestleyi]|uniref:HNH endonuclease n=1 Tax=Phormidesmis priestleyi TaxID=268141 RepID=A0A2W4YGS0_9CYAN|nr:MAG: HNH endonuclease [Phormidesmis priestleyi]